MNKRVLVFDRARIPATRSEYVPKDAHVEVETDGCAYLCVGENRLLFAGSVQRLLAPLGIPNRCLVARAAVDH